MSIYSEYLHIYTNYPGKATMSTYHPKYGTLLTSREVSDLTGFTMNQLRYFRQNADKSPFPLLRKGQTTLYREQDIQIYVDQNGAIGEEYVIPEGFSAAPLVNPTYEAKSNKEFATMAKIVTSNAWSKWTERLTDTGVMEITAAYQFLQDETVRLYKLKHGVDLREKHDETNMDFWLRKNDPVAFWEGRTYATRSLARTIYNWDLTDEDILNAPIGDNPPAKIE
jgi:hypothetical protein